VEGIFAGWIGTTTPLSAHGMIATQIAALLHHDPATVRRWITRHDLEDIDGRPDRRRGRKS
jgi:hypothetical protein